VVRLGVLIFLAPAILEAPSYAGRIQMSKMYMYSDAEFDSATVLGTEVSRGNSYHYGSLL